MTTVDVIGLSIADLDAIDTALNIEGLSLDCDGKMTAEKKGGVRVPVVGRMGKSPQGTRIVCRDGKKWKVVR